MTQPPAEHTHRAIRHEKPLPRGLGEGSMAVAGNEQKARRRRGLYSVSAVISTVAVTPKISRNE
jgi:hypothetical protein